MKLVVSRDDLIDYLRNGFDGSLTLIIYFKNLHGVHLVYVLGRENVPDLVWVVTILTLDYIAEFESKSQVGGTFRGTTKGI